MLFWAVFTLGYIIGTLLTLTFVFKKEEVKDFKGYYVEKKSSLVLNPWQKFNQLVKVNYGNNQKIKTFKEEEKFKKQNSQVSALA